jgi:hypothetical protein
MKFIAKNRVENEKLGWSRPVRVGDETLYEAIEPGDECFHKDRKIVDAEGVIYNAIIEEDGVVFDEWTRYDSADTFERFHRDRSAPLIEVAEAWNRHDPCSLYSDKDFTEFFSYGYLSNVSPSDFIMSVNSAADLADWLFGHH